ncbi:hypothetical protein K470DRAFT_268964 [Piedraia hortae CBS 480.64]|uniref:Uncharacterized protein n=1 Tax=Piedraia hortae CBS 480.64 TaxID=1314780 RepID=A0A6A7C3Y6_9PEZI|nr:hypothetical protein K470DRAFT_268964 [Piedraia hortae CBS 480.64]
MLHVRDCTWPPSATAFVSRRVRSHICDYSLPEPNLEDYNANRLELGLRYINAKIKEPMVTRTELFLGFYKDAYEKALNATEEMDRPAKRATIAVVQAVDKAHDARERLKAYDWISITLYGTAADLVLGMNVQNLRDLTRAWMERSSQMPENIRPYIGQGKWCELAAQLNMDLRELLITFGNCEVVEQHERILLLMRDRYLYHASWANERAWLPKERWKNSELKAAKRRRVDG